MFTFKFCYLDNSDPLEYEGINSVTTVMPGENEPVVECIESYAIGAHDFPLSGMMHLQSDTGNYSVSCNNLRAIEITKEEE